MVTKSMDELLLSEQKKLAEYDEKSKELMEQMHSQVVIYSAIFFI